MKIHRAVLSIAISEADELLRHAILIDDSIQETNKDSESPNLGKVITANILIGLSIEIYLKAFMLAGRDEGMVKGHNLKKLYDEFPLFLKTAIEDKFNSLNKSKHSLYYALN